MRSWPNFYRMLAAEAKHRAARTMNHSARDKLEEVAREWSALAEWAEDRRASYATARVA
jgi:hypothetical protein